MWRYIWTQNTYTIKANLSQKAGKWKYYICENLKLKINMVLNMTLSWLFPGLYYIFHDPGAWKHVRPPSNLTSPSDLLHRISSSTFAFFIAFPVLHQLSRSSSVLVHQLPIYFCLLSNFSPPPHSNKLRPSVGINLAYKSKATILWLILTK